MNGTSEPALVNKILIIIKSRPSEGSRAAEGFRMTTAMIAMNVLPQVLFADDGVSWLIKKQMTEYAGLASCIERLKTISDLIGVHMLSDSLVHRKLKQDDLEEGYNAKRLSLDEASQLLAQDDAVITF